MRFFLLTFCLLSLVGCGSVDAAEERIFKIGLKKDESCNIIMRVFHFHKDLHSIWGNDVVEFKYKIIDGRIYVDLDGVKKCFVEIAKRLNSFPLSHFFYDCFFRAVFQDKWEDCNKNWGSMSDDEIKKAVAEFIERHNNNSYKTIDYFDICCSECKIKLTDIGCEVYWGENRVDPSCIRDEHFIHFLLTDSHTYFMYNLKFNERGELDKDGDFFADDIKITDGRVYVKSYKDKNSSYWFEAKTESIRRDDGHLFENLISKDDVGNYKFFTKDGLWNEDYYFYFDVEKNGVVLNKKFSYSELKKQDNSLVKEEDEGSQCKINGSNSEQGGMGCCGCCCCQ